MIGYKAVVELPARASQRLENIENNVKEAQKEATMTSLSHNIAPRALFIVSCINWFRSRIHNLDYGTNAPPRATRPCAPTMSSARIGVPRTYDPSWPLPATRLLSALCMLGFAVRSATRLFPVHYYFRFYIKLWILAFCGVAFFVLALAACVRRLDRVVAPLHFVTASLALFSTLLLWEGWSYRWIDLVFMFHLTPLALVLIDLSLGARTRFRAIFLPVPQLFLLAHTLVVALKVERFPPELLAARHLILLVASLAVFSMARAADIWYKCGATAVDDSVFLKV